MTTYAIVEHRHDTRTAKTITDHSERLALDYRTARAEMTRLAQYLPDLHEPGCPVYLSVEPVRDLTADNAYPGVEGVYGGELYRIAEVLPVAVLDGTLAVVANPSDGRGGWQLDRVVLLVSTGGA